MNSFGHVFRITTWGESHGPALGVVVDGCPSGVVLTEAMIQFWLDRRRPGQNKYTTQRQEPDRVKILSGVFQDEYMPQPLTTGAPISLMIENTDQRSRDYAEVRDTYRPGHADYVYDAKYGFRDYRGGGRSSARETAARVAAGAVARAALKTLLPDLSIRGAMVQMGGDGIDRTLWDWSKVEHADNPFWTPDSLAVERWKELLAGIRKAGDSIGAVIEIHASGVPIGLGSPIYAKLDQDLAAAMMSINAVKAVEIGDGMAVAALRGSENADEMIPDGKGGVHFLSNHAGGILGGISTGQDVVVRFAVKPTSSILIPKKSINKAGEAIEMITKGRHDPCVGIRAVPVGEAMAACVILDHYLLHRGGASVKHADL